MDRKGCEIGCPGLDEKSVAQTIECGSPLPRLSPSLLGHLFSQQFVQVYRLNLTQNQSVKDNRKGGSIAQGERNGFGQELREAGAAQGSRARAVAAPVEKKML